MSKISNEKLYPKKLLLKLTDFLIGTDSMLSKKPTRNFQIKDIVALARTSLNDEIISIGTITLAGNILTIPANVEWRISDVEYNKITETIIPIPFALTGLNRIDIIVANEQGDIVRIAGDELPIAVKPVEPPSTVLITQINITDSDIGNPTTPLISGLESVLVLGNSANNTINLTSQEGFASLGNNTLRDPDFAKLNFLDGLVLKNQILNAFFSKLKSVNLTANRTNLLPNNDGTLVVTVNNTPADINGNINIASSSQNLQQVLDNGKYSSTGAELNAITDTGKTIVWIGDSIIVGQNAPAIAWRYPTKVCSMLGYTESNLAISGSRLGTASTSLIPAKTVSLAYLVIGYGTNDLSFGDSAATFQTNLSNFVDNAIISKGWIGSQIVLVSMPGFQFQSGVTNAAITAYNTAISNVATLKGCVYIDFYASMVTNEPFGSVRTLFLTDDGTHPNDLGSRVMAKLISNAFELKFNISGQKLVVNGITELSDLKFRKFLPASSGNILGISDSGQIQILSGLPNETVGIGRFLFNYLTQSGAVIPSATNTNDFILKIDSKIVAAFNNTLYSEIVPYGTDGHMTFRNRFISGSFRFHVSPSAGTQSLAFEIQAGSGITKHNFGIAIPLGGGFIEQRGDVLNHGRFHLFTDSGDTELNNAFNVGKYKLFMSNGTAGGKIQMYQVFASGRTQHQNGGTFTDIPSARVAVNSTTEGFLPPRMTTTQKNAISSPATGLMIFDTTLAKLCVYSGLAWETITSV